MGKKKIAELGNTQTDAELTQNSVEAAPQDSASGPRGSASKKKRVDVGVLHVESTYNNTKLTLTDTKGNTLAWSSSGSLGFRGAKKGTPFAAAKIGETLAAKAQTLGVKEVSVVVKGVGSGRESAVRGFISKGINLTTIADRTPVPHNGPKAPKPRRT